MEKYISKSALVAEIERRKANIKEYCLQEGHDARFDVVPEQLSHILSFLDTLEVKEIDLENEVDKWYNNEASKEFENVLYSDIENCAKYFFELGLSVSNKAEKKEVEEEPYIMGETGKFTTTTKAQKGK